MGTTIHYKMSFTGTKDALVERLKSLRKLFGERPVMSIGRLLDIRRAEIKQGFGRLKGMRYHECELGMIMTFVKDIFEDQWKNKTLKYEEREQAIRESGNGIGFHVDVDRGCEYFRVMLGRLGESEHWRGQGFTKTCYARDFEKAHGAVLQMLRMCEETGILESVYDEAGQWENIESD